MKKNTIKLNESTLRKIVAESVKKVLKEEEITADYQLTADYQFKQLVHSINSKFRFFKETPQIYPSIADTALSIAKDLVRALEEYKEVLDYRNNCNPNAREKNPDGTTNPFYFDKDYRQYTD